MGSVFVVDEGNNNNKRLILDIRIESYCPEIVALQTGL